VGNPKELKHISLCAGYGGIDLGLKRALGETRTVCFVEIEAYAIENLVNKIESNLLDMAPIFTDLKRFPWELFSGRVDILSGGFPCQPFSHAGRKRGSEDPRHLWPHITNGIERLGKPPLVFFENVEGIISSKLKGGDWTDPEGTPVLLHVLRELERLGYRATASVFSASEIGAPHQRKRVFILGVRNNLGHAGIDYISELIKVNQSDKRTAYPTSRGQRQHIWEPPRVTVDNADRKGLLRDQNNSTAPDTKRWEAQTGHNAQTDTSSRELQGYIESEVGGDADGSACRVDYDHLYESYDNRTDELRLLGNGVVPDTATRAFRVLWRELVNSHGKRS